MATYDANGNVINDTTTPDLTGLLGAVLGKQVNADTASKQTTVNTTATDATTAGTQVGSQNTTNTGSQNTSGTTTNIGSQKTTGTVGNTGSTTNTGTQTQTSTADIAGLQSVYDRQSAGITPEMLAAIFTQGSKAAPGIVTANAQALGARAQSNTPLAAGLEQMSVDLTSKAADLNRQMLSDAGNTAAQIAQATHGTTTSNTGTQTSLQSQVQDLLTANNSQSIVQQIVDSLSQQAQQNQQATTGSTKTTGTQNQVVDATQTSKTNTTINQNVARQLAGLTAGSVGVNELFKIATGKGFAGNVNDFLTWLKGAPNTSALAGLGISTGMINGLLSSSSTAIPAIGGALTDPGNLFDFGGGAIDVGSNPWGFSDIPGFADGGQVDFLPTQKLIKPKLQIGDPDADLNALINSLGGSNASAGGSSTGSSSSGTSSSGSVDGGPGAGSSSAVGGATGISSNTASAIGGLLSAAIGVPGIGLALSAINSALNGHAAAVADAANSENASSVNAVNGMDSQSDAADAANAAGDSAAAANGGDSNGSDAGSNGDSGGVGPGFADGGLAAFTPDETQAVRSLLASLGMAPKAAPAKKANGGLIKGPGTGTSDSIPAVGPSGQAIQVSNDEYIVPADVVKRFGVDAFDKMVSLFHTPVGDAEDAADGNDSEGASDALC
jgi:hypothetical protein